jgi:hypothetical protein
MQKKVVKKGASKELWEHVLVKHGINPADVDLSDKETDKMADECEDKLDEIINERKIKFGISTKEDYDKIMKIFADHGFT